MSEKCSTKFKTKDLISLLALKNSSKLMIKLEGLQWEARGTNRQEPRACSLASVREILHNLLPKRRLINLFWTLLNLSRNNSITLPN